MALSKYFENFGGINYRTPELLKNSTYSTELRNVRLSENFSLSKRRGYQHSSAAETGGLVTFINTNLTTGATTTERLVTNANLNKINVRIFEIYIGTANAATAFTCNVVLDPDTGTFKFYLVGEVTKTIDLGTGKEVAPYTLADLKTEIETGGEYLVEDDITDMTMPAAFLKTSGAITSEVRADKINAGTDPVVHLNIDEITAISSPAGFTPFAGHFVAKADSDWEINNFVQLHDVLYITNKYDGLMKYDGVSVYKAGLPKPPTPTQTGALTGSAVDWEFRVLFRHTDEKDNPTQSVISDPLFITSNASLDIRVDTASVSASLGYKTADIAVELYRTIDGGQVYYLVDTQTATGGSVSFTNETVTDADLVLNLEFVFPERDPVAPPKCAYMDAWRNAITLTGDPLNPNTVYVADVEGIEGFDLRNSLLTSSRFGGPNTGVKSLDNHLFVFKDKAINMISGDIAAGALNVQTDTIADDGIGCTSHNSIVEAMGRLYFVSLNGIYSVNREGLKPESDDLTPIFTRPSFKKNRCVSVYWIIENKVLFLLPDISGEEVSTSSRILVKDLISDGWYIWDNLDCSKGLSLDQQALWFAGQDYVSEILTLNSSLDYADHELAVPFIYKTHWEALGEPAIYKKFLRLKVYTIDNELQTFDTSNFSLDIRTQYNYNDIDVSIVPMSFGADEGSGYDEGSWDEFGWGDERRLEDTKRLSDIRCRSMRVDFRNNVVHENVLISGFELEYVAQYGPALKDGR
jgi:hypothetical protein